MGTPRSRRYSRCHRSSERTSSYESRAVTSSGRRSATNWTASSRSKCACFGCVRSVNASRPTATRAIPRTSTPARTIRTTATTSPMLVRLWGYGARIDREFRWWRRRLDADALGEQLAVIRGVAEEELGRLGPLEVQVGRMLPREADAAVDLDVLGRSMEVRLGAVRLGE